MSDVVLVLVQQVVVMFLLMIVGFIVFKSGMIEANGVAQVSNIVLYVATPATVINSFIAVFDRQVLIKAGWTFLFAVISVVISVILVSTVFKKNSNIARFAIVFNNVGFLGIPLVQMVLGNQAVFYMTMFVAVMTLMTFTYGVWLISNDRSLVSIKKIVTNPAIIAVFVGLIIYCLSIPIPSPIQRTVSFLSGLNAPLAMMVLGCYLAEADMKAVFANKETYLILLGRLILVPRIMLVILKMMPASLSDVKAVVIIAVSTPVAGALGMFAQKYGSNYAYGAGVVSLSTILSLVTMPLFLALL